MGRHAESFLFLGELKLLESCYVRDAKRTHVRDAIRRYSDKKFGTKQISNDVLVTRIK